MAEQTEPNIHDVLRAMRELEKLPAVAAYIALQNSLKQQPMPNPRYR